MFAHVKRACMVTAAGRRGLCSEPRSAGSHKSRQAKHLVQSLWHSRRITASWVSFQRQFRCWLLGHIAGRQCVKEPTGNTKVREEGGKSEREEREESE